MRNVISILLMLIGSSAFAQSNFELEGVARDGDGKAIQGTFTVNLRVTKASDQNCTLYKETHTGVQSDALGFFTVVAGSQTHAGFPNIDEVTSNSFQQTCYNPANVSTGTFAPTASERREVYISMTYSGNTYEVGSMTISPVPLAAEAARVGAHTPASLLRVENAGVPVPKAALTGVQFDKLVPLLSTTSTDANKVFAMKTDGSSSVMKSITGAGTVSVTQDDSGITITGTATPGNFISGLTGDVVATGPGSVGSTIQPNAVTTGKINDGAVTTAKLADGTTTTVKVADKAITLAKIQDLATNSLLGRSTASTGAPEVLTVGSGLSLSGGTLTATNTNAGTVTNVANGNAYLSVTSGSTTPQISAIVGTAANTLAAGNDSRITGALQKSGGTMTGAIDMGGQDLSNAGNVTLAASKNLQLGTYGTDPAGLTTADKGKTWYNTTSNQVKYWDGSAPQALGISGAGLTLLNGQSGSTQTFAAGATGTAPAISSTGNVHTLNVPLASGGASVTSGTISNSDYNTFNNKVGPGYNFLGDVTGTPSTTVVSAIKGKTVSAAPTAIGQVLRYNGTQFDPAFISMFDLRSTITGAAAFGGVGCTSSQTLTWTVATDNLSCTDIVVGTSNITNNSVGNEDLRQGIARSVIGVTGNATANVADIQGVANQVLRVDNAGAVLAFGQLNLASSAAVTGILPAVNIGTGSPDTSKYLRGDGSWQTLPAGADNLGNHTATQNLNLAGNKLVGGGSAGISIDSSGNVAIGTSSPSNKLSVSGNLDANNHYIGAQGTNDSGTMGFGNANGPGIQFWGSSTLNAGGMAFLTAGTVKMTMLSSGNVGIGTTSPDMNLHIKGKSGNFGGFRLSTSDYVAGTSGSGLYLQTGATTGNAYSQIQSFGDGDATQQKLSLNPAGGNVGIGSTSPSAKLQVDGDIIGKINPDSDLSIDFSTGNLQYTTSLCISGADTFDLTNIKDGGVYTLIMNTGNASTTPVTCHFKWNNGTVDANVRFPPGHGAAITSTSTIYSFMKVNSKLFVTWVPGYQ